MAAMQVIISSNNCPAHLSVMVGDSINIAEEMIKQLKETQNEV